LLPKFSVSLLLSQARRYEASGFTYVGTVLSILSKRLEAPESSTLRWCVGGGAPEPVWRRLSQLLNLQIHELYGMTETGGVTSINSSDQYRVGSVGIARGDFEVKLVGDDDELITAGVGEIVVRPRRPWLMANEYFNKHSEWSACTSNLWFHTGDLGSFDEDNSSTPCDCRLRGCRSPRRNPGRRDQAHDRCQRANRSAPVEAFSIGGTP
jgi:acyl-CoA synthetase (AMP-forming)/AMP-acid ligase II